MRFGHVGRFRVERDCNLKCVSLFLPPRIFPTEKCNPSYSRRGVFVVV